MEAQGLARRAVLGGLAASPFLWSSVALAAQESLSVVSDGTFTLPVASLSRGREVKDIRDALTRAGQPINEARTYLNISVLKRGDDVILFDCGAGQNFVPGAGHLMEALSAAQIKPEQVKHVLFTHAHPDHLWGALDDFNAPAFPNAQFHLSQSEYDFWHSKDIWAQLPEDRQSFAAGAQRILKELTPVLKLFKPGAEIVSGILSTPTPGHTPGHVSYEVKVGSEIVTVIGDALTHPILSFEYPDWAGGFDHDGTRAGTTRKSLLDQLAAGKRKLIAYHLPNQGQGRVEKVGAGYRFVAGS